MFNPSYVTSASVELYTDSVGQIVPLGCHVPVDFHGCVATSVLYCSKRLSYLPHSPSIQFRKQAGSSSAASARTPPAARVGALGPSPDAWTFDQVLRFIPLRFAEPLLLTSLTRITAQLSFNSHSRPRLISQTVALSQNSRPPIILWVVRAPVHRFPSQHLKPLYLYFLVSIVTGD